MGHDADQEGSGFISWPQLRAHLEDSAVRAWFKTLGIDVWDLSAFFVLLGQTSGGGDKTWAEEPCIEIDAFVRGCLRLKGQAKNVDILVLKHETTMLNKQCASMRKDLLKEMKYVMEEAIRQVSDRRVQGADLNSGAFSSDGVLIASPPVSP